MVSAVASPVAPTSFMGRGAVNAAISMLSVPRRSPAAFSQKHPPCFVGEIMQTGAVTRTRSSTAASRIVCVAPPEAPVQPIRAGSTSGSDVSQSIARMLFQVWSVARLSPQRRRRSSRNRCPNGLLSPKPTMS